MMDLMIAMSPYGCKTSNLHTVHESVVSSSKTAPNLTKGYVRANEFGLTQGIFSCRRIARFSLTYDKVDRTDRLQPSNKIGPLSVSACLCDAVVLCSPQTNHYKRGMK